ncbi:hypothetical protein WIT60_15075 [Aquabacterium sp. G14]|uniref:hypothetical protein n=1 Tax=Aquabacterium sp. G14 TaxID=3130164 RepID=UPI0030B26C32
MSVQLKWGLRLLWWAVLALALAPLMLAQETVFLLGEESGPIEQGSVWVWLVAAVWTLGRTMRAQRLLPLAFVLVKVLMGVREAGLPPDLVPSGKALLTWRYYVDAAVDPLRRAITGVLLLIFLAALVTSVVSTLRYLWREQGWRRPDGQFLTIAFGLLVTAQLAERWAGHQSSSATDVWTLWALMFEEGLECLAGVFTLAASSLRGWWVFRPLPQAMHAAEPRPSQA